MKYSVSLMLVVFAYASPAFSSDAVVCKKLHALVSINKSNPSDVRVKDFSAAWTTSPKTGDDLFVGLDIDGDGKDDLVVRSCGHGEQMLCSLTIKFSSGGEMKTRDLGAFYLARETEETYLIETIGALVPSHEDKRKTKISIVKNMALLPVCE